MRRDLRWAIKKLLPIVYAKVPLNSDEWQAIEICEKATAGHVIGDDEALENGLSKHAPNDGDYAVSWDGHFVRFHGQASAEMFAAAIRVQGYHPMVVYAPKGREDEACLVPEVPL